MDEYKPVKRFEIINQEAVIALAWCNLRCPYCREHRLVLDPDSLKNPGRQEVLAGLSKVETVRVTGGEPLIHRGLPALLKNFKDAGARVILETNGTQPEILELLIQEGLVDGVDLDVKAPLDDESYSRLAGVDVPAQLVRMSLEILKKNRVPHKLATTLVPGMLSMDDVLELAGQLTGFSGLRLVAFDPEDPLDPDLAGMKTYSPKEMKNMQEAVDRVFWSALNGKNQK